MAYATAAFAILDAFTILAPAISLNAPRALVSAVCAKASNGAQIKQKVS